MADSNNLRDASETSHNTTPGNSPPLKRTKRDQNTTAFQTTNDIKAIKKSLQKFARKEGAKPIPTVEEVVEIENYFNQLRERDTTPSNNQESKKRSR